MSLISIIGDVGSGKTLLATIMAVEYEGKVYSNYKINIDNYVKLEPYMLASNEPDKMVIMDEAWSWLESRVSGKNLNKYFSYVLFESRKTNTTFVVIAQLFSSVDKRFREMSNVIIACERRKDGFSYTVYRQSSLNPSVKRSFLPEEVAEKYYHYYDTKEIIPIHPDLVAESIGDMSEMLPEIDDIVDQLVEIRHPRLWIKSQVQDWCLRNGKPKRYVGYIYDSLKARCD